MTNDEPGLSLDYAAILKRRRWSLIVPTALGRRFANDVISLFL